MVFAPRIVYGDLDLTDKPYSVEFGFDLGAAETLHDVVSSLMVDGSFDTSPGAGNRTGIALTVLIEGTDSTAIAEFQAALDLEAAKPFNTLTFYPGDGEGPPSVLETFPGNPRTDRDQNVEEQLVARRVFLTMSALPFVRSEDAITFVWADSTTELDPLTSLTGWTTTGTTPTVSGGFQVGTGGSTTFTKTLTLDNYLWLKVSRGVIADQTGVLSGVTIDGVSVPSAQIRLENNSTDSPIFTVPTHDWQGKTVPVSFTLNGLSGGATVLTELWRMGYPRKDTSTTPPRGIDIIDVEGSARTTCLIQFTAPAGGAFVLTGPDLDATLRDRGAAEMIFANFTVSAADGAEVSQGATVMWFPAGTHSSMIGLTSPQPSELNPNGIWPQQAVGSVSGTGYSGKKYVYPTDSRVSISFFETSGAKSLVSPSPALPEGYHGDAVQHEVHTLHAGRCAFAVLDINGSPISTTVTYYPRWWSDAAL